MFKNTLTQINGKRKLITQHPSPCPSGLACRQTGRRARGRGVGVRAVSCCLLVIVSCLLVITTLAVGCGQGGGNSSGGGGTATWDSTSEEAAVKALTLEAFELFPVDLANVIYAVTEPSKWQNMQEKSLAYGSYAFISPFSMHAYLGNHTEGRGKWYFSYANPSEEVSVYMPCHGIITRGRNSSLLNASITQTINGIKYYSDTPIDTYVGKHTIFRCGHLSILASIRESLENSQYGYITVAKGEKIGCWSVGGEIQILDGETNNGLSSVRYSEMNTYTCPMKYFSPAIQATLESYYQTYVYDYVKSNAKRWPEVKYDSPLNVNVTNEVWGTWYYLSGLNVPSSYTADLYPNRNQFNMGIIALLSWDRGTINHETFDSQIALSDPHGTSATPEVPSGYQFVGIYNDIHEMPSENNLPEYGPAFLYVNSSYSHTEGTFLMMNSNFSGRSYGEKHYLCYRVDINNSNSLNNKLYIGIGDTAAEALSNLNSSPITYALDAQSTMGVPTQPIEP